MVFEIALSFSSCLTADAGQQTEGLQTFVKDGSLQQAS
jgi:hypothetical protein